MITSVADLAHDVAAHWHAALIAADLPVTDVIECGSIRTGLFIGPRPDTYSASPDHQHPRSIIELDLRIVMTAGVNPLDSRLLAAVEQVTKAKLARAAPLLRWGLTIPQASLYRRTPCSAQLSIEWDVSVNAEPYFETAEWWSLAYSAEEITRQRALRHLVLIQRVPRALYEALKTLDARELRWRLCTGLADPQITSQDSGLHDLQTQFGDNPVLTTSVAEARRGSLPRPDPRPVMTWLRQRGVSIGPPEPPPAWVQVLEGHPDGCST